MKSSIPEERDCALSIFKETKIFARMKPHHKSQIVSLLKEYNQAVMMVGGIYFKKKLAKIFEKV
jgi:magnesium-transporting ATPase (P-type)